MTYLAKGAKAQKALTYFGTASDGSVTYTKTSGASAEFGGMIEDQIVTAGNFVIGVQYRIVSIGNTTFTNIGAATNNVGALFTATAAGSGTGTAVCSVLLIDYGAQQFRSGYGSSSSHAAFTSGQTTLTFTDTTLTHPFKVGQILHGANINTGLYQTNIKYVYSVGGVSGAWTVEVGNIAVAGGVKTTSTIGVAISANATVYGSGIALNQYLFTDDCTLIGNPKLVMPSVWAHASNYYAPYINYNDTRTLGGIGGSPSGTSTYICGGSQYETWILDKYQYKYPSGSGLTINITAVSSGLISTISSTPTAGGSGYAVNDHVSINTGSTNYNGYVATAKITSINTANGAATGVSLISGGSSVTYTVSSGVGTTPIPNTSQHHIASDMATQGNRHVPEGVGMSGYISGNHLVICGGFVSFEATWADGLLTVTKVLDNDYNGGVYNNNTYYHTYGPVLAPGMHIIYAIDAVTSTSRDTGAYDTLTIIRNGSGKGREGTYYTTIPSAVKIFNLTSSTKMIATAINWCRQGMIISGTDFNGLSISNNTIYMGGPANSSYANSWNYGGSYGNSPTFFYPTATNGNQVAFVNNSQTVGKEASFTASMSIVNQTSGNNYWEGLLTVSSVETGTIFKGMFFEHQTAVDSTYPSITLAGKYYYVNSQLAGTPGGAGTYKVFGYGISAVSLIAGWNGFRPFPLTIKGRLSFRTSISSSSLTGGPINYIATGQPSNNPIINDNSVGQTLNYNDLTIDLDTIVTTSNSCRGLIVYVSGNCTISGTLSMTGRGYNQAKMDFKNLFMQRTTIGYSPITEFPAEDWGASIVPFLENAQNGSTYGQAGNVASTSGLSGGGGGTNTVGYGSGRNGAKGHAFSGGSGGGGASLGGGHQRAGESHGGRGGQGGTSLGNHGYSFTGGSGGAGSGGGLIAIIYGGSIVSSGSINVDGGNGGPLLAFYYNGGAGTASGGGGGAGNPGGAGGYSAYQQGGYGQKGTGGALILVVKGTLTINNSGTIESKGCEGGFACNDGGNGGNSGTKGGVGSIVGPIGVTGSSGGYMIQGNPTVTTYTENSISYTSLKFNGAGSVQFVREMTIDTLLVGGGGGGGSGGAMGGGGGGGSALIQTNIVVPAQEVVTVAIGAGGAGAASSNTSGSQGTASSLSFKTLWINSQTAYAGGFGGGYQSTPGPSSLGVSTTVGSGGGGVDRNYGTNRVGSPPGGWNANTAGYSGNSGTSIHGYRGGSVTLYGGYNGTENSLWEGNAYTATFTGTISGTTLTVTSVSSNNILIGQAISGTGISNGTVILEAINAVYSGAGASGYAPSYSTGTFKISVSHSISTPTVFTGYGTGYGQYQCGGGGGGAGGTGGWGWSHRYDATQNYLGQGGSGGPGIANTFFDGTTRYYGGGGGGGGTGLGTITNNSGRGNPPFMAASSLTQAMGGAGGGGNGRCSNGVINVFPTAGGTNTGGGAGGGSNSGSGGGEAGGSGLCIIRFITP